MLSFLKREKSKKLENQLNTLQKEGPAAWADLPEDELFTPAGFHAEQAEATASSNYSYWGSTFRAFFKNKAAVALLIALVAVVAFAFLQPYLPGLGLPCPARWLPVLIGKPEVTRQLCGGFLFPQPVQGSYKINHIPICTTSEAVETLVQLHAGGLIVVERAASHPVSVYPDSVMLRSLSCRNGLLHSFKYIQINSSL